MDIEGLNSWHDRNGNEVRGNKKRYNKCFEYLINNDPSKVISKYGIKIRQIFHPLLIKLLPFTTKNKLKVVRSAEIPKDKRVIFVPTHGFRDDIALTLKTAKDHAYLVYASLPDFYYSLDGLALWANGVYLMNRADKSSKKALSEKIKRGFQLGVKRVILFPEGVWNKDPNQIVLDLWPGIYKIAKENNAVVMPIASLNKDMDIDDDKEKTCYSILGEPIDLSEYSQEEALRVLRDSMATLKYELMERYSHGKRENIGDSNKYWNAYVGELINTANGLYDYKVENESEFIQRSKVEESDVFEPMARVQATPENAYVLSKTLNVHKKQKKYY